jgi:hypothetical protein
MIFFECELVFNKKTYNVWYFKITSNKEFFKVINTINEFNKGKDCLDFWEIIELKTNTGCLLFDYSSYYVSVISSSIQKECISKYLKSKGFSKFLKEKLYPEKVIWSFGSDMEFPESFEDIINKCNFKRFNINKVNKD